MFKKAVGLSTAFLFVCALALMLAPPVLATSTVDYWNAQIDQIAASSWYSYAVSDIYDPFPHLHCNNGSVGWVAASIRYDTYTFCYQDTMPDIYAFYFCYGIGDNYANNVGGCETDPMDF